MESRNKVLFWMMRIKIILHHSNYQRTKIKKNGKKSSKKQNYLCKTLVKQSLYLCRFIFAGSAEREEVSDSNKILNSFVYLRKCYTFAPV